MPKFCAKSTKAASAHGALVGLVLFTLGGASVVRAESFTVTLTPAEQTGAHGAYLSAPFDFGIAFSEIESVRLGFVMPDGYEGSAVSTGNSSYSRSLASIIHDASMPLSNPWALNLPDGLSASTFFDIRPGETKELHFKGYFTFGDEEVETHWPSFLLAGTGRVAWIDVFHSSHHPLPDGVPSTSSTSWLTPPEIASAELTIVGTPIPEPASYLLLMAGAILLLSCRRLWWRSTKGTKYIV